MKSDTLQWKHREILLNEWNYIQRKYTGVANIIANIAYIHTKRTIVYEKNEEMKKGSKEVNLIDSYTPSMILKCSQERII